MKINKFLIGAGIAAVAMSMGSCTGDLDLMPTDPSSTTPGTFASDPETAMRGVIADLYLQFATYGVNGNNPLESMDGGMSTFQRAVFNLEQIPTDEANWLPTGDAIDHDFQYGDPAANNQCVMGAYSRLMLNVTLANQFMQTDYGVSTPQQQELFDEFSRQARIMRDATYFYLIDLFGNVPWADESVAVGSVAPQLSTNFAEGRRMVFERVVEDLEDLVAWYKANDPNNRPPYGYAGLDVAEAVLVKFYLNAEVFSGTARWKDCFDHAQAIISRLGKGGFNNTGLCKSYFQNFAYNNNDFAIGGASDVNEIIWDIPQQQTSLNPDGIGLMSYANGTLMCNAFIGTSAADDNFHSNIADYNSGNGWKCITARRQFVEVFDWNADFTYSPDIRTAFWRTAADGFNINNDVLDQAHWGNNGFLCPKYNNWYINDNGSINYTLSPAATDQLGVDYGMIRLAEIYLSAAEAALHGGGDNATALQYVNYIRERAGMDAYDIINLPELYNERQRELYNECCRRTDLIREGKWISGYTWNWKTSVASGADYPERFKVYPLPTTVVTRNGYVQNPGY